jgi:hypothetical protein
MLIISMLIIYRRILLASLLCPARAKGWLKIGAGGNFAKLDRHTCKDRRHAYLTGNYPHRAPGVRIFFMKQVRARPLPGGRAPIGLRPAETGAQRCALPPADLNLARR